jgi:hypothetical protein
MGVRFAGLANEADRSALCHYLDAGHPHAA